MVHEVDINDWIHVAVVYENKTPSLYLDGTYVTSGLTSFKTVHPSAGRGDIYTGHTGGFGGGQNNGSPNFYGGWLDEIRFYSRALSVQEINDGMNGVIDHTVESDLVGYWRFDEGSGLTALDMTTNQNHATIDGASWSDQLPDQIPPAIPTGVVASAGDHQVLLQWDQNMDEDLDGYEIHRSSDAINYQLIYDASSQETSFIDVDAENSVMYQYKLLAYDQSKNKSAFSEIVQAQPLNVAPAVPANAQILSGDGEIQLSWTPNGEWDIDHYNIYMSSDSDFQISEENLFITVSHPNSQYTVDNLTNSETYYFKVTSVDLTELEREAFGPMVGNPVDIAPSSPLGFGGMGLESQIELLWTPNDEWDLSGYNLYRSEVEGFVPSEETLIATLNANDSIYTDSSILTGTLYFYVLSAVDISGNESQFTTEVAIFPSASRYSIEFNSGGQYQFGTIEIGSFNLKDSLGLELWFKTDVASDPLLYRKDGYDDDEAYWALEIFNSKIIFEGLTKDGSPFSLTSSSEIEFDKWIHCSVFIKSDSIYMYKDGLYESSIARPTGGLAEKALYLYRIKR